MLTLIHIVSQKRHASAALVANISRNTSLPPSHQFLLNSDVLRRYDSAGKNDSRVLEQLLLSVKLEKRDTKRTFERILKGLLSSKGVDEERGSPISLNSNVLKRIVEFYNKEESKQLSSAKKLDALFHKKIPIGILNDVYHFESHLEHPSAKAQTSLAAHYCLLAIQQQNQGIQTFTGAELELVLVACVSKGDVKNGDAIFKAMLNPSDAAWSLVIELSSKDFAKSETYFRSYLETREKIGSAPVFEFAKALIKTGQTAKAIAFVIREVPSLGVKASIDDLNGILFQLIMSDQLEDALELFLMMKGEEGFPNPNSYTNTLGIAVYSLLNDFKAALNLYIPAEAAATSTSTRNGLQLLGLFGRLCVKNSRLDLGFEIFSKFAQSDLVLFLLILTNLSHSSLKVPNFCDWLSLSLLKLKQHSAYTDGNLKIGFSKGLGLAAQFIEPKELPAFLDIAGIHDFHPLPLFSRRVTGLYMKLERALDEIPKLKYHMSYCHLLESFARAYTSHRPPKMGEKLAQLVDRMEQDGFAPTQLLCTNVASILQSNPLAVRKWKLRMLKSLSLNEVGAIPDVDCPDEIRDRLEEVTEIDEAIELHGKLVRHADFIPAHLTLKVADLAVKHGNVAAVLDLWEVSSDVARRKSIKWTDIAIATQSVTFLVTVLKWFLDHICLDYGSFQKGLRALIDRSQKETARELLLSLLQKAPSSFVPQYYIMAQLMLSEDWTLPFFFVCLNSNHRIPVIIFDSVLCNLRYALECEQQEEAIWNLWKKRARDYSDGPRMQIAHFFLHCKNKNVVMDVLKFIVSNCAISPSPFFSSIHQIASSSNHSSRCFEALSLLRKAKELGKLLITPEEDLINLLAKKADINPVELCNEFGIALSQDSIRCSLSQLEEPQAKRAFLLSLMEQESKDGGDRSRTRLFKLVLLELLELGYFDAAFGVLREQGRMIRWSTDLRDSLVHSLLSYEEKGASSRMEELFKCFQDFGVVLTSRHFTLLMATYAKELNLDSAKTLLHYLVGENVANPQMFSLVFSLASSLKRDCNDLVPLLQSCKGILLILPTRTLDLTNHTLGLQWDNHLFNAVLQYLLQNSKFDVGMQLYEEASTRALCDQTTFEIMFTHAGKQKDTALSSHLLTDAERLGFPPEELEKWRGMERAL